MSLRNIILTWKGFDSVIEHNESVVHTMNNDEMMGDLVVMPFAN